MGAPVRLTAGAGGLISEARHVRLPLRARRHRRCAASPPADETPDATRGFITRSRGVVEPLHAGDETVTSVLLDIARMVSPRVAARSRHQIVIDVGGLERLVGDPKTIGERLRQAAADRGIAPVHVAVAGTCTAAMLLAAARAGVTVAAAGREALAPRLYVARSARG
jgi:hypothetical protein